MKKHVHLSFLFPNLPIILFIALSLIACNKTGNQNQTANISIIINPKSISTNGYGVSYILYESEDNKKFIVDEINSKAVSMAGDPMSELLFKDIIEYDGFEFGLISKLPEPKLSGVIVKKCAVVEDCIVNNKGKFNIKFDIFYVVKENGQVNIYKEKWLSEWSDKAEPIDRTLIYSTAQTTKESNAKSEVESNSSNSIKKVLTYKWCECGDYCASLFVDEQGVEYNFGDISKVSNYHFQCYSNNSSGGVDDPLKERKFLVEFRKLENTSTGDNEAPSLDYQIISIKLQE